MNVMVIVESAFKILPPVKIDDRTINNIQSESDVRAISNLLPTFQIYTPKTMHSFIKFRVRENQILLFIQHSKDFR